MDTSLLIRKPAVGFVPRGGEVRHSGVSRSSTDLLSRVWEECVPELSRVASALGIRRDRIEDLLQDVWVTAWQNRPSGLDGDELRRWLYRVTVNRCRLEHRQRGRWKRALEVIGKIWSGVTAEEPARNAQSHELHDQVEQALAQLGVPLREIVVLRYFCDFDSRQIGEMLDLPHSTVRSHLRAARQQLACALANWKHDDER